MSGHSKWSTIKRAKEKNDIQNAKIFTKLGREIAVAVKLGGADPDSNPKLKNSIAKAKSMNMPNDNINRVIKKAAGDGDSADYENITYEGYGPGGSAVIVFALTDNKNRTASDVRHSFDKFGGSLGPTNCVSYMFNRKGVIYVENDAFDRDELMLLSIDAGAEDFQVGDEVTRITTSSETLDYIKEKLESENVTIDTAQLDLIPQNYVTLSTDKLVLFQKMINMLNDNDDVQEIYHNVENELEEEI